MKETLIQYKGGGYSGCSWEWNYGFFDKESKYHDVFSTGLAGCPTQELIKKYIQENRKDKDYYLYRVTSKKALKELAVEINTVQLTSLVTWFDDVFPEYGVYALCSECGCKITDSSESCLVDWHGCGGIASTADKIVCSECHASGSCGYCGEYYGENSKEILYTVEQIHAVWDVPDSIAETVIENYAPLCVYCAEFLLNKELDILIEMTKKRRTR